MKRTILMPLFLAGALVLTGCGGNTESTADASKPAATAGGSSLDAGPRAAESPVDATLASQGEQLFQDKGCSACHAFGAKMSGPDLQGVAARRTAAWMEKQILRPDVMAKDDPIARGLIAQHALQMPNQGLTPDEAKAVVEFLKSKEPAAAASSQ